MAAGVGGVRKRGAGRRHSRPSPDMAERESARGPGRPRGNTSPLTRERIVRTARHVFSELGYDATTFQAIATRAGVTRPAINYYFTEKRKLYGEVVETTTAMIVSPAVRRAREAPCLTTQLSAFLAAVAEVTDQDRSAAAFLVTSLLESQRHPQLGRGGDGALTAIREFLTWAVDGAVQRGELAAGTDASALVEMLLALLWGMSFYAGFLDSGQGLAVITAQLRQLLSGHGWQPARQPLQLAN